MWKFCWLGGIGAKPLVTDLLTFSRGEHGDGLIEEAWDEFTLAGRTAVMGYAGWLHSYGTDFGTRPEDIRAGDITVYDVRR